MNILTEQLLKHHDFIKFTKDTFSKDQTTTQPIKINNLIISYPETGVLQIEPENPGSIDIIVSSGIHGNETAPIEICNLLIGDILSGELTVNNRVLFIIGNIPAMNKGLRFEVENMNRLFCGKHHGKSHFEARRAARLEQVCERFFKAGDHQHKCHFDLHTAIRDSKYEKFAIYPYQDGRSLNSDYLALFNDCGIDTILLAHQPAGTFSYFTSHQFRSNSLTVERGKVKPFGENNIPDFSKIINVLGSLISDNYIPAVQQQKPSLNLFKVVDEVLRASEDGFSLNIDSKIANFSNFPVGFELTTDDNNSYLIKSDKHAIVFPNADVPVGQRVALIVEKTII